MRLMPARTLDDFEEDEELAGWAERERRKDRRRQRRQARREHRPPQDRPTPPPASYRRASPLDEEPAWDDLDDEDGDALDLLADALDQLQGTRRRRRTRAESSEAAWSRPVQMSHNLRIQAVRGYRAAVMQLKPGLFLVAEMPEEATRASFGFAPLLAPLMVRAARKVLHRPEEPSGRALPQLPGPVAPGRTVDVAWAEADDVGCDRCGRRCA